MQLQPFKLNIPQAKLDDLQQRLAHIRWPAALLDGEWCRGVPVDYLQGLAAYWRYGYDWRKWEAQLNTFLQFITEIDGQAIHFLHIQSPESNALPLVITHGWPGSFVEFLRVIGPLTDPRTHGGDPADAFHLVIPSLPGHGFSSPLSSTGWTTKRTAKAWAALMKGLGYTRYGAQGGDWGAFIAPAVGRADLEHVVGVHVNAATFGFIPYGPVDPAEMAGFSAVEKSRLARLQNFMNEMNGYFQLQATRPQTLSYGLADSPVGQLAWIVEKFKEWTHAATVPEDAVDRDHLLTNVMLYWLTNTAASSANLYYETMHQTDEEQRPGTIPTGVAVFAEDVAIRRYAEQRNNIVHWSEFDRGGHFAALEVPDLLVGDIRRFFRRFRY